MSQNDVDSYYHILLGGFLGDICKISNLDSGHVIMLWGWWDEF